MKNRPIDPEALERERIFNNLLYTRTHHSDPTVRELAAAKLESLFHDEMPATEGSTPALASRPQP